MNISEVPARDVEDAWIEKYRRALEAAPTETARKLRLDEILARLTKNLASNIGRVLDQWRQPKTPLLKRGTEMGNSAVLHTATATSKKTGALAGDAERARMAS